MNFLEKIKTT